MKASTILCRSKVKQIGGMLAHKYEDGVKMCAMGVIIAAIGWKPRFKKDGYYENSPTTEHYEAAGKLVGGEKGWEKIIIMNNHDRKTFKQIGDWLKRQGL